jgi:hypothetical protein
MAGRAGNEPNAKYMCSCFCTRIMTGEMALPNKKTAKPPPTEYLPFLVRLRIFAVYPVMYTNRYSGFCSTITVTYG